MSSVKLGLGERRMEVVGAAGIEPATLGLEIRCSIRLSYAPLDVSIAQAKTAANGGVERMKG